jgi:hypothetical protein
MIGARRTDRVASQAAPRPMTIVAANSPASASQGTPASRNAQWGTRATIAAKHPTAKPAKSKTAFSPKTI